MTDETKRCPFCDELIRVSAVKCRYCGSMLGEAPSGTPVPGTRGTAPGAQGIEPAARVAGTIPECLVPAWSTGGAEIPEGTEIREYRILKLLGRGGMGEVYLAEHTYTGQKVAVKAVHPGLMADQGARRRFLEEGRVMAGLKHPNIVQLYTFFEEAGRFFLVMEYLAGMTLEVFLKARRPGREKIVSVSRGVLDALGHAHGQKPSVVHRDVKPANVFLEEGGSVKVMDFGIAKVVGREKLTKTGGVVGTYEYMSPEQVRGEDVGPSGDLYSFGVVLYQMLAGRVPFPQDTDGGFEVMEGHVKREPPALKSVRPDVPEGFQGVVDRALAKDAASRHGSASALKTAIERAAAGVSGGRSAEEEPRVRAATGGEPAWDAGEERGRGPGRGLPWAWLIGGGVALAVLVVALAVSFGGGGGATVRARRVAAGVAGAPVATDAPAPAPAAAEPVASVPAAPPPAAAAPAACVRQCEGRTCGPDGCGGHCGACPAGTTCREGSCACDPQCEGRNCGSDGCGGQCGTCGDGFTCSSGRCACVPQCVGKDCGPDRCGAQCGYCRDGQTCQAGRCACLPQCAGRDCGPDGCGGECGECAAGAWCQQGRCAARIATGAPGPPPGRGRIFIHYAAGKNQWVGLLEGMRGELIDAGWPTVGELIEVSNGAPNDVRYYHAEDREVAEQVRNFVQKRVRGAGSDQTVKINPKLDFEGRLPSMGTIEVWLNP